MKKGVDVMNQIKKLITLFAITLMLSACGGGGGGGSAAPGDSTGGNSGGDTGGNTGGNTGGDTGGTGGDAGSSKTATVSFSVISTARLPVPIEGVALVAFLPAGTTVATDAGSTNISSSALTVSSAITSPVVFGTYSAAANKVKISVLSTADTYRGGEFATLTVSYPSTATLTASDFTSPNSPAFPLFQAAGFDAVSHSSFDLANKLRAVMGVTFN